MTLIDRRACVAGMAAASLQPYGGQATKPKMNRFVSIEGMQLRRGDMPYRVAGTNMWYAAWLGSDAPFGDRARLLRELERLKSLGVNNIRIMVAAEEGPLRNTVLPGFSKADGSVSEVLLTGLDYAMCAIARHQMTAVLCLGNFWEWSGGFSTWLYRQTGRYIDMGDPSHPWPAFADASADFYASESAVAAYQSYVSLLLGRTNSFSGVAYRDDPTIFSWQLANEPRPGGSDRAIANNLGAYLRWIETSVHLIRGAAPKHLVSLGQEGSIASNGNADIVQQAHRAVDYLTAHIWPLNWGWVKGNDLAKTWPDGKMKVQAYVEQHVALAREANKPLLIEEFGFPRDNESYDPYAGTGFREDYYRLIYSYAEASLLTNGPIAGTNFWAWNGEARAAHTDYRMRQGENSYMGDPPHEPQGWYGVFNTDLALQKLILTHARNFASG